MLIETTRAIHTMWDHVCRNESINIRFISPTVATFLASVRLSRINAEIRIDPSRRGHAEQSGLNLALTRNYAQMSQASREEMQRARSSENKPTRSRLTTLFHHAEIESCNVALNDLLFAQLEKLLPATTLSMVAKVVGELHDNVASHANGRGFSAAQFYRGGRGNPDRLELSIADGGWGFMRNVRSVLPLINSHEAAIRWCLEKGNTSKRNTENESEIPFPSDFEDPYSEGGSGQRDHHMGWGLWLLHELVLSTGGELWIWSGDCSFVIRSNGEEVVERTKSYWPGVIITLMFYPETARTLIERGPTDRLEFLAEELGL